MFCRKCDSFITEEQLLKAIRSDLACPSCAVELFDPKTFNIEV